MQTNTEGVFKAFPEAGDSTLKARGMWTPDNISNILTGDTKSALGLAKHFSKLKTKTSHLVTVILLYLERDHGSSHLPANAQRLSKQIVLSMG